MKKLLNAIRTIKKRWAKYTPIIEVVISRAAILHNLHEFQKTYPKLQIAPVLKSNAYGHGLVTVAEILQSENIPFLAVDSLYEANVLRESNVHTPIMILDFTPVHNIVGNRYKNISFAITSLKQLQELAKTKHEATVHIKLDTGMHRQGLLPNEISEAIKILQQNKHIHVEGIYSHFANAHRADKQSETQAQISIWEAGITQIKTQIKGIKYFHLANTAGAYFMKDATCNLVRSGIGIFGHNPSPFTQMDLKLALRMETMIGGIKKINAGACVGYNSHNSTRLF
ncbi:MAG: alanine racemase [Candidatus Magasanikbacteria bacterium]|nr:alanine racemase [Candidatus Magasanikbacteria bacterium]